MRGREHLTLGIAVGLTGFVIASAGYNVSAVTAAQCFAGACLGELYPDIDLPKSTISNFVPVIPSIFNRCFGHRNFIHTPFNLFLIFLVMLFSFTFLHFTMFCGAFMVAFLLHLLQDTMTNGGIMWLYPFWKGRIHFTRHGSNERIHVIFTWIMVIFYALSLYLLFFKHILPGVGDMLGRIFCY